MIEPLVEAVREHIIRPQSGEDVPADRRLFEDLDAAPLDVTLQSAEVVPVDSTPINPEIGNGIPSLTIRHRITVAVACQSDTYAHATASRNAIVTDLMRRVATTDWANVPELPAGQYVTRYAWLVEYPDLDPGSIAAWATITLTLDTEWTL